MALKELVAEKSALTEEAIEEIIKDFVRYDANEKEIAFTPEFGGLSNKAKVLVYLVALQGWPYVLGDAVPTSAKPSVIEEQLGIPGGTLRPLLKDLKDRHLLSYKDGSYSVRAPSFDGVKSELNGSGRSLTKPRRPALGVVSTHANSEPTPHEDGGVDTTAKRKKRIGGGRSNEVGERFRQWVGAGFFDDGRTLGEVQERFHEEAIIIPQTSIPKYLLAAVRDGRLTRSKEEVGGKERWVYRTKARGVAPR